MVFALRFFIITIRCTIARFSTIFQSRPSHARARTDLKFAPTLQSEGSKKKKTRNKSAESELSFFFLFLYFYNGTKKIKTKNEEGPWLEKFQTLISHAEDLIRRSYIPAE